MYTLNIDFDFISLDSQFDEPDNIFFFLLDM